MPGRRSLIVAAGLFFSSSSSVCRGHVDTPELEDLALAEDDQCAVDDQDCALNALQRRVHAGNVAQEKDGSSRRREKTKGHDISEAVAQELEADIYAIYENATTMEWRVYYMNWDLKSAEAFLDDEPNRTIGVNGSRVNWNHHDVTWIPVFSLLEEGSGEDPPEELESEMMLESQRSTSARRRRHAGSNLVGVPPLTKKCQLYMTKVQEMLDVTQEHIAKLERRILAVDDSMASLAQGAAIVDHADVVEEEIDEDNDPYLAVRKSSEGRRRRTQEEETGLHQPEEARQLILDQIAEAQNETTLLWEKIGDLTVSLQSLKTRIGIDDSDDFPVEEIIISTIGTQSTESKDNSQGSVISDSADSAETAEPANDAGDAASDSGDSNGDSEGSSA